MFGVSSSTWRVSAREMKLCTKAVGDGESFRWETRCL